MSTAGPGGPAAAEAHLAHYALRTPLGRGATGEVWLAEDTRLHRLVALKLLRESAAGDAQAGERLLREARLASVLNHPNLAVIYDVGEAERDGRRTRYVAMELVQGRTLAALAQDGPLAAALVLQLGRQAADALAAAHARGIVHRDVKPGNLMVDDEGRLKVLDFGLAWFTPPAGDEESTWSGGQGALAGALAGTLAYMAPEQLRGGALDGRADVFALGVVLYELLAGQRPFRGETTVRLVEAILREPPPPLRAEGSLEQGLAQLVARMLEKDPARRPADMREVCRELDELASGRTAAPPLLLALLAVTSFANITGRPEDAWLGVGLAETVAAGLSQLPGLGVLSRERVSEAARALRVADEEAAHAERLGRELGARTMVAGAFQVIGDAVRVTARVTDVASGRVSATVKVDGNRGAIFDVQDRLVGELAGALRSQLPPATRAPEDTHHLEAYEAYSKGLVNLEAETQESLDRAIAFFERAIALDPGYARAHVHLGAALDVKGDYLGLSEISERALAVLERAIELRPDSAEAWRHKGAALITLGRAGEAIAAFELALALDPTDASAHSGVGRAHFVLRGDFAAAIRSYERALALNPRAGWTALQLANCALYLRDFERAERAARLAADLQQSLLSGHPGLVIVGGFVRLGQAHALQGRHREALAEYARELDFLKTIEHPLRARIFIELHQRIGEAHLRLGERERGLAALDLALEAYERRLRGGASEPATPYYAACALALRGEREAALDALERTAARLLHLTAARAPLEPALEPLLGEPRFQAILERAKRLSS